MRAKTMLAAGAVAVSIAAGAGAGALLFTPTSSIAQSASTTAPTTDPGYGDGRHLERGLGVVGGPGVELGVAAKAIGITEDQLRTELQSGKSIAEVAKAHDVDPQKVIDALVADAKARLQQAEADLPSRITAMVNGQMPFGGAQRRHFAGPGGGLRDLIGAGLDTAATAIGITPDQLRTELQSGKSIADVAKAHDVDPQKVIDALVAAATQKIDAAVSSGKLTPDQATALKNNLSTIVTNVVNGQRPAFGRHRQLRPSGSSGSSRSTPSGTAGYVTS